MQCSGLTVTCLKLLQCLYPDFTQSPPLALIVQEGVAHDPDDLLQRNTQNLMSAVSSLPELQEKKVSRDG